MKLHLNLTLRRALMAAMAMVALHTADATITTPSGNMYLTGEESPTVAEWTAAWGANKGVLSVGTSEGAGTLTLTSGTYTTPNAIFLGGKGYNSTTSTANNGTLTIEKGATLTATGSTNVGNSLVGGSGTLTLNGGKLNAGNSLYVGVNKGTGTVTATDGATITINSGSTGAVFAISHRNISGLADTVTLTGSAITVGTKGGVLDYTSIGHSLGTATLTLESGSTATFNDQLIVGEKGASNGTIHVHGSTLNMGTTTVLGAEANASGTICLEDGIAKGADTLVLGSNGTGSIEMTGTSSLTAGSIELGDAVGSNGYIDAQDGTITTDLLTIGTSGSGSVYTAGTLTAKSIVIGKNETASGYLTTEGNVSTDTLYAGEKGTGVVTVLDGTLTAKNAYIVGTDSKLATEAGTTTLTNATVLAGELSTSTGATTKVIGQLILDEAAELVNTGTTNVGTATVAEGSAISNEAGTLTTGTLTGSGTITNAGTWKSTTSTTNYGAIANSGTWTNTGSATNYGSIANSGTWNVNGKTTSATGTITNDGTANVRSELTTGSVSGTGTTNVLAAGSWTITGQTDQGSIANNGAITLQGAGRIDAETLSGTGTTTITIDGTTVATGEGLAIIEVGTLGSTDKIKVDIDTDNGASLVGKTFNFVEENGNLEIDGSFVELNKSNFFVDEGWNINWDANNITFGDESNGKQLTYVGGADSMNFTKLGAIETSQVEIELPANVTIELEVVTETVLAVAETPESKGMEVVDPTSEEEIAAATDVQIQNNTVIHSAEISQGVQKETQEEIRTNVVIGKDVTSTGDSGSTKVQSVVVNQKTTIETPEGQDNIEHKETVGVSGVALVLNGKSEHKGTGTSAELGFNEGTKEGTLLTRDTTTQETVKNEVKKIDIVQVEQDSDVTVTDMSMHSTHALTIAGGTTITFDSVNLHVGGTTDVNLTKEVEVKLYDENGNVTGTEIQTVDSGAHLTTESTITQATVKIMGMSVVTFEKIDDKDHHSQGSTTFSESDVEVGAESTLGDNAGHMQEIVFTDETSVKNSGNVNNAKFDKKSKLHNNNGTVDNVVISNGSHLTGKGNLKKVHVDKDSYLTVGSSPGKFTAEELTVDGKTSFYIITDSKEWNSYTGDSSQITATERQDGAAAGEWGGISQLVVDGSVTLNGQVTFIYQHFDDATGEFVNEDAATARKEMGAYFKEGSSIKFVDFGRNGDLTLGSNFSVDLDSLPELAPGLFWDVNSLFTESTVYVIAEILEEPTRVANSLVSAGETVLNFGRLAQNQAALREAGTTRTWGSAIAMFDSIDTGSTTNGYDYSNWGAAVGVDHAFTKNTVVGVAFGCTWGENEAKEDNGYYSAGSIDQDAKMIALYGTHKFQTKGLLNDVKLSAFAAYGMFENDSTRNGLKSGNRAEAEWDSDAWVLSASLSRDITTDSGVVFTPYVGVEYTTAGMDDFTEKGKSYTADYSADEDYSNLSVKVGVGVSKTYGSFTPYANVAFISDVDRTAAEVTADGKRTITGKSALPGRNGFELGVGATWQLTENLDVNAGYSAEIRDKATEHNARVGVGYTF